MSVSYELAACVVCGGSSSRVVAATDAIRAEVEALWEHHTAHDDAAAPLLDRLAFTQRPPLAVHQCRECGLLFRNPRERHVREIYEEEDVDTAELAVLAEAQRGSLDAQAERLSSLNGRAGRVLEVGPYTGAFLDAAARGGWHVRAVDVNATVVGFLRERGHDVSQGALEDEAGTYDAVVLWNCFDQVPDPLAAARAAHARLRPHGLIALRVPNGEFYLALRGHLDGALHTPARTLLARHNWLGFPYRHGFTPSSLTRALEQCGFDIVRLDAAGALPVPGQKHAMLADAGEAALRPLTGSPWLELYARAR